MEEDVSLTREEKQKIIENLFKKNYKVYNRLAEL